MQRAHASYDIIVIGGGINGAGIARDAALRQLRVLLLDAHDFGSGTTSWSSRLIHGGLRYLEHGEIPLVYESLHERRTLRRIAPHLVSPLRLVIPLYRGGSRAPWLVRLGMIAYDLLSLTKSLPRHRMLSRDALLGEAPGLAPEGLVAGASYFDAQVTHAERLVIENVVAAAQAGAAVRNHAPVNAIELRADGSHRVRFRHADGADEVASGRSVVNATGPWVDRLLALTGLELPRLIGGTKGSHLVLPPFTDAPRDAFYVEAPADGRPVFILPWNGQYLVGTTDIRFDDDPGEARASAAEVDYLLATLNRYFPRARVRPGNVLYAYAGVRPLPYRADGPESAITRRHIIHAHTGDATGLWSVIGGKLTTYRSLARQVVDRLQRALDGGGTRCRTATTPLPGGGELPATRLARLSCLSTAGRERWCALYGSRAARLADLVDAEPGLGAPLDDDGSSLAAEVAFAIREEFAGNLVDIVHRRLMTGLQPDQGNATAAAIAAVAAREFGWSEATQAAELRRLADYNRRLREPAEAGSVLR
ncbi:MAG: glycerol-3-phosphate dehydrogenase [Woeseiaceae bacterium]|nr:glycerol-3-phosphate dehydrogenase [Woeseiaceae bacterium]